MTHAVVTGPIRGTITTAAGEVVDVTPPVIFVDSVEQAAIVADLIARRYVEDGHPDHLDGAPFTYIPATDLPEGD